MSGVLASVDMRTQLAGHNRLELLLFRWIEQHGDELELELSLQLELALALVLVSE